jgi:hypothetical protein
MPELNLCIHCNKPIYPEAQQFVVTNKTASEASWQYAHVECHEQKTSSLSAAAVSGLN